MTDTQLYLAIGVPMLFNALLFTLVIAYMNARFHGFEGRFEERFHAADQRLEAINQRFG